MQTASEVAEQQRFAVDEILGVLGRHDPEAKGRIEDLFAHGARKWSVRGGVVAPQDELLTIVLEAVTSLARVVDQQAEESKPRPRGRPPKKDPKKDEK
jgi:hypothetical protein